MDEIKYKVYVKLDENGNILNIDGGVTIKNVDVETWSLIDEGTDALKYGGCQQHYLDMPLMTPDGIPRYKWNGTQAVERSEEEIEEDRAIRNAPTVEQQIADLKAQLSATDYKVVKCSEAQLAGEELPYDIAELHAERQVIRDRINELEKQL